MRSSEEQYKKILEDRISELKRKIAKLNSKQGRGIETMNSAATKINGYKIEIQELEEELANTDRRRQLSERVETELARLDRKYRSNERRTSSYEDEIDRLKEMRENLTTIRARRKVDKRISQLNDKISKLKNTNVKCAKKQRRMMIPRYKKDFIKNGMISRAEGRVENYENLVRDNEALKGMLDDNKIIDNIKGIFYDIKGRYYQKKLERSQEILTEMQRKDKIITMAGARITSFGKKRIERIRQRRAQQMTAAAAPAMAM